MSHFVYSTAMISLICWGFLFLIVYKWFMLCDTRMFLSIYYIILYYSSGSVSLALGFVLLFLNI